MKRLIPLLALFFARPVAAGTCQKVEVSFKPVPHLQLAVWIEDGNGKFIDTIFMTRSTGALGLGNRPGDARFKSAYRWPYGRREMVLPIWAHAHGKHYPYVIMGGSKGVDPHDDSIGYHEAYSSTEPFYCAPSNQPLDAVSCASQFVGSKGVYQPGSFSFYPPRADLRTFSRLDSVDAQDFAAVNDVAAISGATPRGDELLQPPLQWSVPADLPNGHYVVKVEASLEGDFGDAPPHPSTPDFHQELRSFGHDILGQPSVVYAVPIVLDGLLRTATTDGWVGYGDWDGATGTIHPPDGTIADVDGSGAGRLLHVSDANGRWRVKVTTAGCDGCRPPAAPTALTARAADTTLTLSFAAPQYTDAFDQPIRYEIRYQPERPLDDASFASGIPADQPPLPAAAGQQQTATLTGLKGQTLYYVGVRAINTCGQPGPGSFTSATTVAQRFVTLHGCFIATAAYGSPMANDVALLRRWRDLDLLPSPLGRLFVASYYALSPPLAGAIDSDERLRGAAREALRPLVALARGWLLSEHHAP